MKRVLTIILVSLIFTTCEIGLGTHVNLVGPVVSISGPRSAGENDNPTVNNMFNFSGTVESKAKIARLEVKLDYWNRKELERIPREWKWDGKWMIREDEDSEWAPYNESSYDYVTLPAEYEKINPPSCTVKGDVLSFNLPVLMDRLEKGEYYVRISAWDTAGMHDSNSTRSLRITYNNEAPSLKIIRPALSKSGGGSVSNPRPPDYQNLLFDPFGDPETTYSNLENFINNIPQLAWEIESDNFDSDGYTMYLAITGEGDLDAVPIENEDRITYWSWNSGTSGNIKSPNGIFSQGEKGASVTVDGYAYTIIDEAVNLTGTGSLPANTVTPMQLVSRVRDTNGNEEYSSKGWFAYLPDSDKPYANIIFAKKAGTADPKPPRLELPQIMRTTDQANNQAYDDDGLKSLAWTLYRYDNDSKVDEGAYNFINGPQKAPWPFTALAGYGLGDFYLDVRVKDIYDVEGDTWRGYFSITSKATPTLKEWDSGLQTDTLWGDSNGNITIGGIAQVECADGCDGTNHSVKVDRVTIVWINPDDITTQLHYAADANSDLWDAAVGKSSATDEFGNKVWELPSGSIVFDSATTGNQNGNTQEDWHFSLDLNLFSDLGIRKDGLPFDDQIFLARLLNNGIDKPLSKVETLNTVRDNEPPVVSIDSITITASINENSTTTSFPTNNVLQTIAQNDTVALSGTWSDNSMEKWKNMGANRHRDYLNDLVIKWIGEANNFDFELDTFTLVNDAGGTWTTKPYPFNSLNLDARVRLSATLTDLSGNPVEEDVDITIVTDYPTFTRISSNVADGVYGINKDTYPSESGLQNHIEIFMEFNKPVYFPNETDAVNNFYLLLNNGARAYYSDGNRTNRIYFRYNLSDGGSTPGNEPLKVDSINWSENTNNLWKGTQENVEVMFPDNGDEGILTGSYSLGSQKNIRIDKTAPVISSISTSSQAGSYGEGSTIIITVILSEKIRFTGNKTSGTFINLSGGNLAANSAKAEYDFTTGDDAISFVYTVDSDHDSGNDGIKADSLTLGSAGIVDDAENPLTNVAIDSALGSIKIDTTSPGVPAISGLTGNTSYYGDNIGFTITGLESSGVTVEYTLNSEANPVNWNTYTGIITGSSPNNYSTNAISLDLNGTYNIAVRQYDNAATTPNLSDASSPVANIRIDRGAILEQVGSASPNGYYGYEVSGKNEINITMRFRIPVDMTGPNNAYVKLNVNGATGTNMQAPLSALVTNSSTCIFTYTINEAAINVDKLNVTEINWGSVIVKDRIGTGTDITGYLNTAALNALDALNKFDGQKDITIISGSPAVINRTSLGTDIVFTGNGQQLSFKFDREIFRGGAQHKFAIIQENTGYRIPAVMTEERWEQIFNNRADIFEDYYNVCFANFVDFASNPIYTSGNSTGSADNWKKVGEYLYQRGSNGTTVTGSNAAPTAITSDTTVKYVLRYAIDTAGSDSANIDITNFTQVTMAHIREVFRAAEALTFTPSDPAISIGADSKTIIFDLSGSRALPVLGANYNWTFPNGFVKDSLEKGNGNGNTAGRDTNLLSANAARLQYSGVEIPVIRVNKDDTVVFNTTGVNRHAQQPLTSSVRVDSRTPNAAVSAETRQVNDNAAQLLMRFYDGAIHTTVGTAAADTVNYVNRLPNLGTQEQNAAGRNSYENTRMRPQSGVDGRGSTSPLTGADWRGLGLNYYSAVMPNLWLAVTLSNNEFSIGDDNYMSGGMIIQIRANAQAGGVNTNYAYETAYRSVFIFNKSSVAGNSNTTANLGFNLDASDNSALDRVWIRGGDSPNGDPTTPDFPISRNTSQYRKVKLLTPIDPGTMPTTAETIANYERENSNIANANIGNGNYLWFWVTWNINVPAYIDLLYGLLPDNENDIQAPTKFRYMSSSWVPFKEHYALFPGRTTVVETRSNNIYNTSWDGDRGNISLFNSVIQPPQTDQ